MILLHSEINILPILQYGWCRYKSTILKITFELAQDETKLRTGAVHWNNEIFFNIADYTIVIRISYFYERSRVKIRCAISASSESLIENWTEGREPTTSFPGLCQCSSWMWGDMTDLHWVLPTAAHSDIQRHCRDFRELIMTSSLLTPRKPWWL